MRRSDRSDPPHEPWLPGWALALAIALSTGLLAWLNVAVILSA
jgi:hypothetical protein